ncbi:hypothetical protein ACFQ0G_53195 [Streptomyces chiangmaiensis]|uniref:hypothetical protein n=1 Tax=Streptomyces chiangmaiensis TaxID=766497 RepID=UPI0031E5F2CB
MTSRANCAEVKLLGSVVWRGCRAIAEAERERLAKERAEKRRQALLEVFPARVDGLIEVPELTLFEAVALHALFSGPGVEDAGLTTPTDVWPKERRWAPASCAVS